MNGSVARMETIDEPYLKAFVGSKVDHYLKKWEPLLNDASALPGYSWAGFLWSGWWLPYRKMYREASIFYSVILMATIVADLLFVTILGNAEVPLWVDRGMGLVAATVCGVLGNRWYLSNAKKAISDVRKAGFDEHRVLEVLTERGGTSVGSALGFMALFFVSLTVIELVLIHILY